MAWTEHQRQLLQGMGLRVWAPGPAAASEPQQPPAAATPRALAPGLHEAAASPAALAASTARGLAAPAAPGTAVSAPPPALNPAVVSTRPELAALGWPELRDSVAACRACGLCESRTQTVFGVGHPQAHWLVVGEAPGEDEDRQGEPFVGASGQLLDRMLAALQLSRGTEGPPERSVYIANTLKCRPPRNRNPSAEELAQCEPFLVRQIELLRPRIILALGRFAVQALLRSDAPIGRLRGQVHRYQGVPLVVSYHPAYLLRSLPEKAKAWEDLCLAADVLQAGA
ncbi:DNA polymerase [beta proteobacterium AAP51]|nr:DNA polymerase [beta proteobacterium AAP51]